MKNLIVGQSGGPTAVINSSLFGVIREGMKQEKHIDHIYGMINGIEGFLKDRYMDLEKELTPEQLQCLRTTPGAFLGSCRYKLPEDLSDPVYPKLFQKFNALNIGYFFYDQSASSPAMPNHMENLYALSVFQRQLTMTWF